MLANRKFFIINSLIITFLVFVVFLGQKLFSDVGTFAITQDQLQSCYPSFIKLGNDLINKIYLGVDISTFNGATEFYLVPNLSIRYPILILFALLGGLTNKYNLFYILFHVLHLFCALFYIQLLCSKFFNIKKERCLLIACTSLNLFLYEIWYTGFAIVCMLVPVIMYYSLNIIYNKKKIDIFLLSFIVYLGFMSGQIQYSLALVIICFVASSIYLIDDSNDKYKNIIRLFVPYFIAGLIALPYYLNILVYIKTIVKPETSTLYFFSELKINPSNIIYIFSNAFSANVDTPEQFQILHLGLLWLIIIIIFIKNNYYKKLTGLNKKLFMFGIIINLIMLFVSFGINTPLAAWFYSIIPILGQSHLPIRYMIVTLPFLYISLGIMLENTEYDLKLIKIINFIVIALIFILLLLSPIIQNKLFYKEVLILELILLVIVLSISIIQNRISTMAIVLTCFMVSIFSINNFYSFFNVYWSKDEVKKYSIVWDKESFDIIDNFIKSNMDTNRKKIYRFINIDKEFEVPTYIPSNLGWFEKGEYKISNYFGYPIHVAVPYTYRKMFPWFTSFNERYISDTRVDFAIVNIQALSTNHNLLENIIDYSVPLKSINSNYVIYKLKQFIPSKYNNAIGIEDRKEVLDNGYFYCAELDNSDIQKFITDDASKYKIEINSPKETELEFMLYPNRYYKYRVNGNIIKPEINEYIAYIKLNAGLNTVEIYYDNILENIFLYMSNSYIIVIIISAFLRGLYSIKNSKNKSTNPVN